MGLTILHILCAFTIVIYYKFPIFTFRLIQSAQVEKQITLRNLEKLFKTSKMVLPKVLSIVAALPSIHETLHAPVNA